MNKTATLKKFDKRILLALLVGVFVGMLLSYLYFQPLMVAQKKVVSDLENRTNEYQAELATSSEQLASASAQVEVLLARPTPKPQVVYETQTEYVPSKPKNTTTNCTSDYAGGMYCYSSDGSQKHCTSNYAGGMNCY
ncbi:MAG: hypothetical protein WCL07_03725 [bacterium]